LLRVGKMKFHNF